MLAGSALCVWGHVKIEGTYSDGRRIVLYDGHNLVVNNGRIVLTELLGQALATSNAPSASYNGVGSIYVGGRVTGSPSTDGSTAPVATQTGLQGTLIKRLPVLSTGVTFNTSPISVDFRASLGTSDGNGFDVQEVGLFTAGSNATDPDLAAVGSPVPRMVARQVVSTLSKTSAISLDFTWRIGLSAS